MARALRTRRPANKRRTDLMLTTAGTELAQASRSRNNRAIAEITRDWTEAERAEFARLLGKFYFRPPAGESWCDVILRLRSVLETLAALLLLSRTTAV